MTERDGAIAPIVGAFVERLDEVVERCLDAIWDAVPSYGRSGDDVLLEEVRDAVRGNVATLAQVFSQGRDISRRELEAIERVGARRAQSNIPLDDVLHAYRTVSRVCWDVLAEECRRHDGSALEASIELAEAVLKYTDQISTAVAEAYTRAQRAIVREQEGARREFLADLLYGTDAPPEEMLARAHAFGYDLSLTYIALVGTAAGSEGGRETLVSGAISNVAAPETADPIVLQKGEQTIALLASDMHADPSLVPEKLVAELGGGWTFGMGGPEVGLEGIRRAYLEAREALEIGLALDIDERVYRFDDLLIYHFLRIEPALVDRFVDQMLGPLISYDQRRKGELVKTISSFFDADGSVKAAGERLFAHPHTVSYRLKQVEKLTGWSLREPEHKLRMQLALRAHRLASAKREIDEQTEE